MRTLTHTLPDAEAFSFVCQDQRVMVGRGIDSSTDHNPLVQERKTGREKIPKLSFYPKEILLAAGLTTRINPGAFLPRRVFLLQRSLRDFDRECLSSEQVFGAVGQGPG